jgi:acid stress-induced BolA-like protein IbaG/YrbA
MPTPEDVQRYIAEGMACEHVEVTGDGRHFEAVIVSPEFAGKSMLQQQQSVYRALGVRMHDEIHALSMKTFTPEQWSSNQ